MSSQIPPLLESHLALPPRHSQVLVTSMLGASSNWLVLRYLTTGRDEEEGASGQDEVKVVLVSFMRDYGFWRDGAARLGLNLDAVAKEKRFFFVDGLERLFLENTAARGQPPPPSLPNRTSHTYLETPRLSDVARTLHAAIDQPLSSSTGPVVLLMDQPDVLLAAAGGVAEGIDSWGLRELVLDLQEKIHATILTLAADEPLVSPQSSTLEIEHASFLLSIAHGAEAVISLRTLESGKARDVSGVVRISSSSSSNGGGVSGSKRPAETREYLYNVAFDGTVRVFERGQ
ncbi:hypothetical protein M406DRAFT_344661 [Cryphonectria parasitica EP155]|uniref:Elongator complex protein 6 n=1 Tax=Cryphonectria parasitica (strain ATCC 38755 / EP155) TaxID=660469 RepID=A0A9P4Y8Q3_CRYP1|nr:uncharacterized protein M406DRAFT_344661 [Cryphonectria parasitica EP155]KAF3768479.1 hypothetical protein M406DRAFT_344661 [Cryphonectria parasitica EP155]